MITPSRFADVMTYPKGYKSKDELTAYADQLQAEQDKRVKLGRTDTKVFQSTAEEIESIDYKISNWLPIYEFGDTALTYAKECALGRLGVQMPEIKAKALDHGNQYESVARALYTEITGFEFPKPDYRHQSQKYPWITGESDGNIYNGKRWGGEIKCPVNPIYHLNNGLLYADNQITPTLSMYFEKAENQHEEKYKWQTNGYCSEWMYGWEGYTFISYNPFFPSHMQLFYHDYLPDPELQKTLEERLVKFEYEIVRPLVTELEFYFNIEVDDFWKQ